MSRVNPEELLKLSAAVLAALRRDGRLPTRLDEEDYNDLLQEGVLAALQARNGFDAARGSLRTYFRKPILRAQLKAAWQIASVGITGDHHGVQVWREDDDSIDLNAIQIDDIADEIEAFDFVWETYYKKILANST